MIRSAATIMAVGVFVLATASSSGGGDAKRFDGETSKLSQDLRQRISGVSWHRGCPVPLRKLRLVRVTHWGFGRDIDRGRLIVHYRHADRIVGVFRRLFRARFPIRQLKLIDRFGGDDRRSMAADNTSGFNCRYVAGRPGVWSQHAYGRAIDVNPVENPYVTPSGHVSPPAGARYADRSRDSKGMVHSGDAVVRAFMRAGWAWGGSWNGTHDYQHFSANGR